ncbi:hypothetical protein D3C86_2013790 [compost metagenome]
MIRRTDARTQQQSRGAYCTCADNDFALRTENFALVSLLVLNANSTAILDENSQHLGISFNPQVASATRGVQVSDRRTATQSIAHCDLVKTAACLLA